ncbi:hypothetical protein BT93_F2378 [Corymbia citriodora subsp. variegata]|nr:hypothetical protein BT93_F2378 [Corymbia citriodora subsp. variegata]
MAKLPSVASINLSDFPPPPLQLPSSLLTRTSPPKPIKSNEQQRRVVTSASKSGGVSLNSILKSCKACSGKGAIECPGCKRLYLVAASWHNSRLPCRSIELERVLIVFLTLAFTPI